MNAVETAKVLAYMHVAWPAAAITEQTPAVWAEMLVGVDPRDGEAAATNLMRTSKWFPSIAEFVEAAKAELRARSGDQQARDHRALMATPELDNPERPSSNRTRAEQIEHNRKWIAEFKAQTSLDRKLALSGHEAWSQRRDLA